METDPLSIGIARGLTVALVAGSMLMSCGRAEPSGKASLVIELEGAPSESSYVSHDAPPGGLVALGDVDEDGFTDIAVGITYEKRRSSSVSRGSLTAYSGEDGKVLWCARGKSTEQAEAEGETPYWLGEIAPAGDLDGDGILDIYVLEEWSKSTFLVFSGRDGRLLTRQATPRRGRIRPLRVEDISGDGKPDLIFRRGNALELVVLSGDDFCAADEKAGPWTDARDKPVWMTPRFADVDRDGVHDYLVRRW